MDPLTKLRRRPFMAPLLIPLLGILMAVAGVYWLGTWSRTTVVVLDKAGEKWTVSKCLLYYGVDYWD